MKGAWLRKMNNIRAGRFNSLLRALCIVVLALLVVGSFRVYKFIWPTPYVAKQSGFQIVFPGVPTLDKLPSQNKSGVQVSGTIYSVDNQAKGTDYAVYATNYSHVDFTSYSRTSRIETLESEVDAIAKNDQLNLSDGKTTTFDNLIAVEATLAPSDPSVPSTHVLAFLNRSRLYILLGAGISTSKFNSYIKTFRIIN